MCVGVHLESEVEVSVSRSSDTYQLDGGGEGERMAYMLLREKANQMQIHQDKHKPEVVCMR